MERDLKMPRVSVILPVHNGMPYLPKAVESILGQTFRDFEFVIVNDASTDDTATYLAGLPDPRVRVIRNQQNLGVARSLNKAIGVARGEYIARQDADDVSLVERLEAQVNYLDRHPEIAVLGTRATCIDGGGNANGVWSVPTTGIDVKWRLLFDNSNCIIHPSAMIRSAVLRASGGYPEDAEFSLAEDYALWCRIARYYGFANLEQRLLNFRIHGGSVTGRQRKEQDQQVRRIAFSSVAWTMNPCRVMESDYEAVCVLLLSSASCRPEFSAAALRSAVELLSNLQRAFYARGNFDASSVFVHRKHVQWVWGKHLVALSMRGRFSLLSRVTSFLLGANLIWDSFKVWMRLFCGRTKPAVSEPVLVSLSSSGEPH